MEFESILRLFDSIMAIKRKYPMIITYNKHLKKLTEDKQTQEVECFRQFLIKNQALRQKVLDCPTYVGTKKVCPIYMQTVLDVGTPEVIDTFWSNLFMVDDLMFPDGKPEAPEEPEEGAAGGDPLLASLEANPVLADIMGQMRESAASINPGDDATSILQSPALGSMVNTIKSGLSNGKYKLADLTKLVTQVMTSMNHDLDADTMETLTEVTNTMGAVERGETPDLSKVMNMVGKLKLQ